MEKKIKKCEGKMCSGNCASCRYSEWRFMDQKYYCNEHYRYVDENDSCDDYKF